MTIQLSNAAGITANFQALSDRLAGGIVLAGDEGWDSARQSWNLAADQRPAAVALPESAEDVLAVVEFARAHGLSVAPQGTGHGALPLGPLDETILLSTASMRGVQIDPVARCARVQAGERWGKVATATAEHGLAGLAGSSPHVGVVGYSIGGGCLLAEFPAAAVDTLAATAGPESGSPLGSVEVRHLGGALARRLPEHGALASLDAGFAVYTFGMARTPEMGAAIERQTELVLEALAPWLAESRYLNFVDRRVDTSDLYPAGTFERLRRVKAQYDPGNLIRSNHPIPPHS
jgi:hypothetical protein